MTPSNTAQTLVKLHTMNLGQIKGLLAGLGEQHLEVSPYPTGHDLRWVLGHIAVSLDFCGSMLGLKGIAPEAWGKDYGSGSTGHTKGGPGLRELVDVIERGHARVKEALENADASQLGKPHGIDFFAKNTPLATVADAVAFMVTNHEAYHVAQLSACRSAAGLKPLF
ncbi:MAG: DinB family protein [Phycisphaerales bacterium]